MQYIEKSAQEPEDWNDWFTTEIRTHVYNNAGGIGRQNAKAYLLEEQHGLCAYCQSPLEENDSSIEHVVPNKQNLNVSTLYHNLVAVCKAPPKDSEGRSHCDKERGDKLLPPLIFYKKAQVTTETDHGFFGADNLGKVFSRNGLDEQTKKQVDAFIDILNLNHNSLVSKREALWKAIWNLTNKLNLSLPQRKSFLQNKFNELLEQKDQPYRQYLTILIKQKLN